MDNQAIATAILPVVADIEARLPPVSVTRPSWYAINAAPDKSAAEVSIYEEIGSWGVTAKQFVADLKAIDAKTINLRLNTPGGEVFDGTAIANALKEHPATVVVHIDGVAASAGSFIAMSGDQIRMANNAYLMIHNARGGVMGDATQMRTYADVLDKINGNIADMYAKKSGKNADHYRTLMDAETWFTAEEAKAEGLVDMVTDGGKSVSRMTSKFDFGIYNKIPEPVRAMWGLQPNQQAPETSQCNEAPPVITPTEANTMATDSNVAPAQGTVAASSGRDELASLNAQAVQGYIEKGKHLGVEMGRSQEMERMKALIEAAPGRPDLVIDAFVTAQSPQALALAFRASQTAQAAAADQILARDREVARLNAVIATGGHPGVAMGVSSEPESDQYGDMEPETRAKLEWDADPRLRAQHKSERSYAMYRVNQLKGNVRVLKTA